jgi:small-conductance mechanosensitive channel
VIRWVIIRRRFTIVDAHELILKEPTTEIRLHELGESLVNSTIRAWTQTENYRDVYWDLMRTVKLRFDQEGISIPFPQRDVHFYPEAADVVAASSVESDVPPPRVPSRAQVSDQPDDWFDTLRRIP